MGQRFRPMLATQAIAIALAAVTAYFVAAGGFAAADDTPEVGEATAEVVAANSVNSSSVINETLQGIDVKNGTLGRADMALGVIPLWAKVNPNGSTPVLLAGKGIQFVSTTGNPGEYDVRFNRSIVGCGWMATRNNNTSGSVDNGEIGVEQATQGDANSLRIRLFNSAGTQTAPASDDGFTVMALC